MKQQFNVKAESPNHHSEPLRLTITTKDTRRKLHDARPRKEFNPLFRKKPARWKEMECAVCRKDFMARIADHRIVCSSPCAAKIGRRMLKKA